MNDMQEGKDDALPHAIYFDTSALRDVGYALRKEWMENIRTVAQRFGIDLCLPEVVLDEWIWYLWQQCIATHRECASSSRFLADLIGMTFEIPNAPEDSGFEELSQRYRSSLESAGFHVVSTAKLDLDELLRQSILHIAPFEERDRGFRDAVILESIASHALEQYRQPNIIIVSFDKGFQRGHRRLTDKKMNAKIVTPTDCNTLLEKKRLAAAFRLFREGEPALNTFLEVHKERIFAEVRSARVNLATLEGGVFGVQPDGDPLNDANIRRINAVRPVSVGRGLCGARPIVGEIAEGREPIEFKVGIEADLTIERRPSVWASMRGPEITLDAPVDVNPFWRSSMQLESIVEDVTVQRELHVEASVIRGLDRDEYRDLQIHRVW